MLRKISITLVILLILIKTSYAGVYVNIGALNARQKDDNFNLQQSPKIYASYGVFTQAKNYTFTIQTNRLLNIIHHEYVQHKLTNDAYKLKTKFRADSLLLGYKFQRFNPSIVLSNVRLDRKIKTNKTQHAILYGVNFNYFINKNFSIQTAFIAKNKKIGLTNATLLSINYYF